MIRAVIFDLDGLLVDSEPIHFAAIREAAKPFNIEFTADEMMKLAGTGYRFILSHLIQKSGQNLDIEDLIAKTRAIFDSMVNSIQAMPGSEKLLDDIKGKLIVTVASGTQKNLILKILEITELLHFFDSKLIVGGDELRMPKPAPDIYRLARIRLRLEARECVALEDTYAGLLSAKKAGMYCIAVPTIFSHEQDFSKADLIVESLGDLSYDILANIDKKS